MLFITYYLRWVPAFMKWHFFSQMGEMGRFWYFKLCWILRANSLEFVIFHEYFSEFNVVPKIFVWTLCILIFTIVDKCSFCRWRNITICSIVTGTLFTPLVSARNGQLIFWFGHQSFSELFLSTRDPIHINMSWCGLMERTVLIWWTCLLLLMCSGHNSTDQFGLQGNILLIQFKLTSAI
jgi:hypothetical protein